MIGMRKAMKWWAINDLQVGGMMIPYRKIILEWKKKEGCEHYACFFDELKLD